MGTQNYVEMITSSRKGIASGGSNSGLYVVMQRARQIGIMPVFGEGSPSSFSLSSSYIITNLVEEKNYGISTYICFDEKLLAVISICFLLHELQRLNLFQ